MTLAIFILLPFMVNGYSSGAPRQACSTMTPEHGVPPVGHESGHIFTIEKPVFGLDDKVQITLSVPYEMPLFKGFMIKAINNENQGVGSFEVFDPEVQLMDCDAQENQAITHTNSQKKDTVQAFWIPPKNATLVKDGVRFNYTVVEEKTKFWTITTEQLLTFSNSNSMSPKTFSIFLAVFFAKCML